MRAFHEYQNEERDISYLVLPPDAGRRHRRAERHRTHDLLQRAQERLARCRSFVRCRIMNMTPADIAKPATSPTRTPGRSTTASLPPASRRRNAARSSRSCSRIRRGQRGGRRARRRQDIRRTDRRAQGLKPATSISALVTRDKLLDPKVAEAAFSLAPNSASAGSSTGSSAR